jgi:integrative and conjugative element protein (TIGR02256 family)
MPRVRDVSAVWLDARARALIERETCTRARVETGGALFGYEAEDDLVIACAYGPGPRARHRRTSFEPDARTTGALIRAVHQASDGRYRYLGSWHSHPNGRARPSAQDLATTEAVADQLDVALPRPLVVIAASQQTGSQVRVDETRAWRWSDRWGWLLPCEIEDVHLEGRWCRQVTLKPPRGRRHVMSPSV